MGRLANTIHLLRGHGARLRDAEQRFFDAYGRGGTLCHETLVIPLGYFAQPRVRDVLVDWLADGGPLDLDTLERQWRALDPDGDRAAFHENIAHFLALLANPAACRVTWRLPDGTHFDYGSGVFR